jgi:hypothetical protein
VVAHESSDSTAGPVSLPGEAGGDPGATSGRAGGESNRAGRDGRYRAAVRAYGRYRAAVRAYGRRDETVGPPPRAAYGW